MNPRFASVITRNAFANQISLPNAYRWDRKIFLNFLHKVEKQPANFGIVKDTEMDALKVIKLIREFDYGSKFRLFTKPGAGSTSKPILGPQEFGWQGVPTKFFGVYDSLGYLTSVMGTATLFATRENYYFPLLATYTKWCSALAGKHELAPRKTFITYTERLFKKGQVPNKLDVALGASIGGAGEYKTEIQLNNWNWMKIQGKLNLGTDPRKSMVRPEPNDSGQLFGHCAETIPIVIKLLTTNPCNTKNIGGICMKVRQVRRVRQYDAEKLYRHVQNPCPNCLEVIRQFRADPYRFKAEAVDFFSF